MVFLCYTIRKIIRLVFYMLGNEFRNPVQLFEQIFIQMHSLAQDMSFVSADSIINEELMAYGNTCSIAWICDKEFKSSLEKNPTSYYFGVATNLLVSGMYLADVWANNNGDLSKVKYTDIYDKGGLWNNVFRLLEDPTDESKKQFQILSKELFDIWSVNIRPYMKLSNAGEYLIDTMTSFFQIGVCIKLTLLGY